MSKINYKRQVQMESQRYQLRICSAGESEKRDLVAAEEEEEGEEEVELVQNVESEMRCVPIKENTIRERLKLCFLEEKPSRKSLEKLLKILKEEGLDVAEQKVLLNKILKQNTSIETIGGIFPIETEEKLHELELLLQTHSDLYVRHMQLQLRNNIGKYLPEILGKELILNMNIDGTHGKRRIKDFKHFYARLLEIISGENPEEKLREALQKHKKKHFRAVSRVKSSRKDKENIMVKESEV